MYNIFIRKNSGIGQTYSNIVTMSFSGGRILFTFKDGSIMRVNPTDLLEIKIAVNVRRVKDELME